MQTLLTKLVCCRTSPLGAFLSCSFMNPCSPVAFYSVTLRKHRAGGWGSYWTSIRVCNHYGNKLIVLIIKNGFFSIKNNAKKRIFFKEMDKTRQLLALVPSVQSHRLCSQINFHTFKHSKLDKLKSFCHTVCQETYNWQRTFLVFLAVQPTAQ